MERKGMDGRDMGAVEAIKRCPQEFYVTSASRQQALQLAADAVAQLSRGLLREGYGDQFLSTLHF